MQKRSVVLLGTNGGEPRACLHSVTHIVFKLACNRFVLFPNSMCYFHGDFEVPGGEIFYTEIAEVRAVMIYLSESQALTVFAG